MSARTSVWVTALLTVFPAVASAHPSSAVDITREDVHTVLASIGRSIDRQRPLQSVYPQRIGARKP